MNFWVAMSVDVQDIVPNWEQVIRARDTLFFATASYGAYSPFESDGSTPWAAMGPRFMT